jgi:hypothetical protein
LFSTQKDSKRKSIVELAAVLSLFSILIVNVVDKAAFFLVVGWMQSQIFNNYPNDNVFDFDA